MIGRNDMLHSGTEQTSSTASFACSCCGKTNHNGNHHRQISKKEQRRAEQGTHGHKSDNEKQGRSQQAKPRGPSLRPISRPKKSTMKTKVQPEAGDMKKEENKETRKTQLCEDKKSGSSPVPEMPHCRG